MPGIYMITRNATFIQNMRQIPYNKSSSDQYTLFSGLFSGSGVMYVAKIHIIL